jgi:DNA primase
MKGIGNTGGVSVPGAGGGSLWMDLSWRILIPITFNGRLVSWTCRHIGKDAIRYRSTPVELQAMDPKTILFGLDQVPRNQSRVVVVEGPMDAVKLGPGALATFGIGWKWEQAMLLGDFTHRYILFDNDPKSIESQKRAKLLANTVQSIFGGHTEVVQLDHHHDPGELSTEEAKSLMSELLN